MIFAKSRNARNEIFVRNDKCDKFFSHCEKCKKCEKFLTFWVREMQEITFIVSQNFLHFLHFSNFSHFLAKARNFLILREIREMREILRYDKCNFSHFSCSAKNVRNLRNAIIIAHAKCWWSWHWQIFKAPTPPTPVLEPDRARRERKITWFDRLFFFHFSFDVDYKKMFVFYVRPLDFCSLFKVGRHAIGCGNHYLGSNSSMHWATYEVILLNPPRIW